MNSRKLRSLAFVSSLLAVGPIKSFAQSADQDPAKMMQDLANQARDLSTRITAELDGLKPTDEQKLYDRLHKALDSFYYSEGLKEAPAGAPRDMDLPTVVQRTEMFVGRSAQEIKFARKPATQDMVDKAQLTVDDMTDLDTKIGRAIAHYSSSSAPN